MSTATAKADTRQPAQPTVLSLIFANIVSCLATIFYPAAYVWRAAAANENASTYTITAGWLYISAALLAFLYPGGALYILATIGGVTLIVGVLLSRYENNGGDARRQ